MPLMSSLQIDNHQINIEDEMPIQLVCHHFIQTFTCISLEHFVSFFDATSNIS